MFTIIAARGKNNELGKDNDLIFHLKEDLKFFKEKTTNHTIIMGRKTFDSLGRLLPNRHHVVLTRENIDNTEVTVFHDLDSLLKYYKDSDEEIFIIGGGSIYKMFLPYASKMYLTNIDSSSEADVFFPEFNEENYIKKILSSIEEDGIKYKHVLYTKIK